MTEVPFCCCIVLQNVIGQAPVFNEVFIDEGDVDIAKAIKAYKDAGFTGVITPDHTPHVSSPYIDQTTPLLRCVLLACWGY